MRDSLHLSIPPKPSPSINDSFWMRIVTRLMVQICSKSWYRKLQGGGYGVIYVSRRLCIRCDYRTQLCEANAMKFIAEQTKGAIPVPKIYCSFERKGRVYILMERLPGETVQASGPRWSHRSIESQAHILGQLRKMVEIMRAIPPPSDFAVGNVDGGQLYDGNLPERRYMGPYKSIQDFHLDLRSGMTEITDEHSDACPGLRQLIEMHNGDWGPPVSGIIDWETAAWMPQYWEFTNAWHVNPYNEFWREEVPKFITPDVQGLEMEKIRRQYFKQF
ncbi:hypothetical protein F503_08669 [Ophiostoma piceae UAMH 11346]|uniref:Aminoglycoside phosphotransferase domain-containing protein n=1 Tax=Ophiostoma piceae (strain UAMH 11346) TaxID=1262450 RepID=S3CQY1_OPHP1|nr:hypothetical protein F503_08669 [Ophiostoma piceae UAMH 11346]